MKKLKFIILSVFLSSYLTAFDNNFSYSINLLWIYTKNISEKLKEEVNLPPDFTYVFKTTDKRKIDVTEIIKDWGNKNPQAKVVLWYDGSLVQSEQVENSKKLFQQMTNEFNTINKINFTNKYEIKDIRNLDIVRNNEKYFSTLIPLYVRVDFLKIYIGKEILEKECNENNQDKKIERCYFIMTDTGVTTQNKDELFSKDTQKNLNDFRLLFNDAHGYKHYENQFSIMEFKVKEHKNDYLKNALDTMLKYKTFLKLDYFLENGLLYSLHNSGRTTSNINSISQIIYNDITDIFWYIYNHLNKGNLLLLKDVNYLRYNQNDDLKEYIKKEFIRKEIENYEKTQNNLSKELQDLKSAKENLEYWVKLCEDYQEKINNNQELQQQEQKQLENICNNKEVYSKLISDISLNNESINKIDLIKQKLILLKNKNSKNYNDITKELIKFEMGPKSIVPTTAVEAVAPGNSYLLY